MRREKELRQQANYDPLTGMANRRMLSDRLAQSIRRTRFSGEPFVLGMLDLDRFKAINDRFGHDAGDEVLCEVARRLSGSVREEDMVARLGGDEFVILLCHCQSEMQVFDRLLSLIKEPIPVGKNGERAQVGASLGLTRFDMDKPIEGEQLLREADQALYYAKANGRDRAAWFDDLQIPVGDMATRS
nr:GGDEF domain-containing protein [Spiribacter sp. 2438]